MATFQDRFVKATGMVGGRYLLTALLQKRIRELVRREKPLVDGDPSDFIDIALAEVLEGKIEMGAEIKDPEDTEVLKQDSQEADLDKDQGEEKEHYSITF